MTGTYQGGIIALNMFVYWAAQIAGALVGTFIGRFLYTESTNEEAIQDKIRFKEVTPLITNVDSKVILAEFLGTFILVTVVFNTAVDAKRGKNNYYGAAIGLTVTSIATYLGKFSGGAFNPAVAISLAVRGLLGKGGYVVAIK